MTDDQPLDLQAVAADDAALDALRTTVGDDAALALLRELLLDVERDLPVLPVGQGTTALALAVEAPGRRLARNSTAVAAATAGLLALGGVAAASTLAPTDSPLHGLGEAVRSAAGAVVGAVTPPVSPSRAGAVLATATASPTTAVSTRVVAAAPRTPTPGATVSAAVRSRAAARQADQLLDDAAALLDAGRTTAAVSRLDLAERKLNEVLPDDLADLPQRLADLREEAAAAAAPAAEPAAKPTRSPQPEKAQAPAAEPPAERTARRGSARTGPQKSERAKTRPLLGQLSSDASMKPRA